MKMKLMRLIFLIGVFVSVPLAINAHHGTGISYNLTVQPVTAKGKVTEFKWANPHAAIFIDIRNEKGVVEHWAIEGNSPFNWSRLGFNRSTLKAGDEITIVFYTSKVADAKAGVIAKAILPDGKEVLRFQRGHPDDGRRDSLAENRFSRSTWRYECLSKRLWEWLSFCPGGREPDARLGAPCARKLRANGMSTSKARSRRCT